MDWKKWKKVKRETKEVNNPNMIDIPSEDLLQAKSLIDNIMSKNIIFFDLETSGFDGKFNQVTQIGSFIQTPLNPILSTSQLNKNNSFNTKASLTTKMKQRLTPGTEENLAWVTSQLRSGMIRGNIKTAADSILKLDSEINIPVSDFLNLGYNENLTLEDVEKEKNKILDTISFYKKKFPRTRIENKLNDLEKQIRTSIEPSYVFSLTGYGVKTGKGLNKKEEHEVISDFLSFLRRHNDGNTYLTGHNIKNFDIKFLSDRIDSINDRFGKNFPKPDVMFSGRTFDTVEISRKVFLPAIQHLQKYFDSLRVVSEDMESFKNVENELASLDPKDHLEIYNRLLAIIDQELNNKVVPDLKTSSGRMSSSQGILAKSLNINAEGWHDALADVIMLSNVLQGMKKLIDLAVSRTAPESSAEPLQEMEPYQRAVTAKHPAAKKRLTGLGKNLDKSSPYKMKLSYKRGKSAPPGG